MVKANIDTDTVNQDEIRHFAKDSSHWWDESGPFKPLHRLNPVRMSYIRSQICAHFKIEDKGFRPFETLSVLDIGCGGGLASESMARMGAKVSGIDADDNAIQVAREHAKMSDLDINYQCVAAETIAEKFDVVLALEIIEHVDQPEIFVQTCLDRCKDGGIVIFSTLNRTPASFALGIVAAEYVLRWVPQGTHQWKKFVKPSELSKMIRNAQGKPLDLHGLRYDIKKNVFELSPNTDINYFMTAEVS
jgi:2-polyprenyl-6-hydroxyphenyl methylase/3-demethylubiquinone-9 3-methyltransferase